MNIPTARTIIIGMIICPSSIVIPKQTHEYYCSIFSIPICLSSYKTYRFRLVFGFKFAFLKLKSKKIAKTPEDEQDSDK